MSRDIDHFPSLSALLREALGDLLAPEAHSLLEMCAEEIVFEFPFSPPGLTQRLVGKAALAAYLPTVATSITIESMSLGRVLVSSKADVAAIEFSCKGRANQTGARYDQDYVTLVDLGNGLITRYRDYWNPLVVLAALNGSPLADQKQPEGTRHAG